MRSSDLQREEGNGPQGRPSDQAEILAAWWMDFEAACRTPWDLEYGCPIILQADDRPPLYVRLLEGVLGTRDIIELAIRIVVQH